MASIINYCTNDAAFLMDCVSAAAQVSDTVIVPVCDHFLDGTPENAGLLARSYAACPQATFIVYPYLPGLAKLGPRFWHNMSRWIGLHCLAQETKYVWLLDTDEIIDPAPMRAWLATGTYRLYQTMRFSSYWYFREPRYRATTHEDSAMLVRNRRFGIREIFRAQERAYLLHQKPAQSGIVGLDDHPMVHHLSWVRTKDEMLKKVATWGHKGDKDWTELIEKEFSREFTGRDFVHGYRYEIVNPRIQWPNPLPNSDPRTSPKNVRYWSAKSVCRSTAPVALALGHPMLAYFLWRRSCQNP